MVVNSKMDVHTFRKYVEDGNEKILREFLTSESAEKSKFLNHTVKGAWGSKSTFIAAQNGHPGILALLIEHGASIERQSEDGLTILMAICGASQPFGDLEEFETKLVKCAEIVFGKTSNVKELVNAAQNKNATALVLAAKNGYLRLTKMLVDLGADLDAADTQKWTALCFAVEKNYGHVARLLLESGANPDIMTLDGKVLVDLVPVKSHSLMEVVEAFVAVKKSVVTEYSHMKADEIESVEGYKKFSELENVLLGIDATEYLPVFEKHKLNLEHFLALNEDDLEKMGIDKVGVRKKMLNAICEIHKRDWDKSSLPKIQPKDRRRGIYFTCPEGVMMVANLNRHLAFLNANLKFLKKNIDSHPELLRFGQDMASARTMLGYVKESQTSLNATSVQLKLLEKTLNRYANDPRFLPADSIEKRTSNFRQIATISAITFALLIGYKVFNR